MAKFGELNPWCTEMVILNLLGLEYGELLGICGY